LGAFSVDLLSGNANELRRDSLSLQLTREAPASEPAEHPSSESGGFPTATDEFGE
jgi:hypothetical protein